MKNNLKKKREINRKQNSSTSHAIHLFAPGGEFIICGPRKHQSCYSTLVFHHYGRRKKQMCELLHLMCFPSLRLLLTQTLNEKNEENLYPLKGERNLI